jgi:DNA-directed RNA polymerase specialized sigma24 family protein
MRAKETLGIEPKQLEQLTNRLDALIRMTVLGLPDTVTEDTKVKILSDMGFQSNEIAPMVGSTANAVRIRLHRLRKSMEERNSVPSPD